MSLILVVVAIAASCEPIGVPEAVEKARTQFSNQKYPDAFRTVQATVQALECATGPVDPWRLAVLFHVGAAAALKGGDQAQAQTWMEDAVRLAPEVGVDEHVYGEPTADLYKSVSEAPANRRLGRVDSRAPVMIDGESLSCGEQPELREGRHLIQYRRPDGQFVTEWIGVESDATVAVPSEGGRCGPNPVRVPLVLGGAALVVGGTTALSVLSWNAASDTLDNGTYEALHVATLVGIAGGGAMMVGGGLLVDGGAGVTLSGRW